MILIMEKGEIERRKKLYGDDWDKVINDEPELPKLSPDFADNVKKHFAERDARDSLLVKRLGTYGADLAIQMLEDNPRLTVEEAIEMIEAI